MVITDILMDCQSIIGIMKKTDVFIFIVVKKDAISSNDKVSFCVYDEGVKKDGEWALNISSVIIFGKMRIVDDEEKTLEIYRKLSLKFTSDMDYIESEIKKFAKATLCYELQPEHITGKIVNEG